MQLTFANDLIDLKILSQWHAAKKIHLGVHRTTKRRRDNKKIAFLELLPSYFAAVAHFYEYN